MVETFLLYFHTIKYLKAKQVLSRFFRLIPKSFQYDFFVIPNLRDFETSKINFPSKNTQIDKLGLNLVILNKEIKLHDLQWEDKKKSKLWLYNLHYFDFINSINSSYQINLISYIINDWIQNNTTNRETGWEAYPNSLRIINWIKFHLRTASLDNEMLKSLYNQVRYLSITLEWHLLGNHLFANAKALIYAGLFFETNQSRQWLDVGLEIVNNELSEQVLDDGGNFELSPMYHSIFLEDLLDLIYISKLYPNIIPDETIESWSKIASKMVTWLNVMKHPDQNISFFNDSALGIALKPKSLVSYASRIGVEVNEFKFFNHVSYFHLKDSGYVRIFNSYFTCFVDVANVGPEYLPGHAHADTLSFELSLYGKRIFVNGGTSEYENSLVRIAERSTQLHNTVEIDAKSSSEVWSSFRVARRAKPFGLSIKDENNCIRMVCSHDGYTRLKSSPIHQREWIFENKKIVINDFAFHANSYTKVARILVHPDLKIYPLDLNVYSIMIPCSNKKLVVMFGNCSSSIKKSFYAPEFGKRIITNCFELNFGSSESISTTILFE